ncbi:hypothetical protein ACOMHN_022214 [Nucella lapillus]
MQKACSEDNTSSFRSRTPQGLGRGRGRTSPSQIRIDSMLPPSHPAPTPVVDTGLLSEVTDQMDDARLAAEDLATEGTEDAGS